jgi:hypothetical protein
MTIQVTLTSRTYNPLLGQFITTYSTVTGTFRMAVDTLSLLPVGGNVLYDVRITLDDNHLYCWNGTTWIDVGVNDVYDYVVDESIPGPSAGFTPNWNDISGKPTSTPVAIDAAVSASHAAHSDDQDLSGKENVANKSTDNTLGGLTPSDTLYPSQQAVKEYVDALPSGGGLSVIQDNTVSLIADETKIITHASDPLYKRVVEILIQLQDLLTFNFNTSTEPNYDYDADKVVFLPIGSDGVSLVPSYGATGMLGYYLFNNDVTDSLDSHDGTNHGVTFSSGIVENKGVFNGSSYFDIPNSSDFIPGTSDSFAVEFWMNNNPPDGEIVSLWNEADNRRSWRLYIDANKLKMDISEDGITVAGTWDLTNTLNTYYNDMHIGLMRNPANDAEIKMFINGSGWLPHSYPGASAAYNNTIDPIRIGAKGGATPTNFFTGWIAELAIYKNFNFDQYVGMYSNVFQSHMSINSIGQHLSQYDTDMQNVKTNASGQIDTSDWLGIKSLSFGGDAYGDFQVTILFSVDGRTTWKKWDGSAWQTALETDEGRNVASLPLTRAEWDLLFVPGTLDYILQLKTNNPSGTPIIYFFVATVYKLGYMLAGAKISFSCLSDTETQIRNDTNIQGPPESFNDIKTNIVL